MLLFLPEIWLVLSLRQFLKSNRASQKMVFWGDFLVHLKSSLLVNFFLKDHSHVNVATVNTVHIHVHDQNWEVKSAVSVTWVWLWL